MNKVTALELTKVMGCVNGIPKLFFSGDKQGCLAYCETRNWTTTIGNESVNLSIVAADQAGHC